MTRILVADDNADSADTLAALLEMMGHSVLQAHDGDAALTAVQEFDPHVVLLDIGMPKRNGYEVCGLIRAQRGGAARRLIALTGWGQPEDRKRSADAGFDVHLVKPVSVDKLIEALAPDPSHGMTRQAL